MCALLNDPRWVFCCYIIKALRAGRKPGASLYTGKRFCPPPPFRLSLLLEIIVLPSYDVANVVSDPHMYSVFLFLSGTRFLESLVPPFTRGSVSLYNEVYISTSGPSPMVLSGDLHVHHSGVVQVDARVKSAWFQHLKLKYDKLLSSLAVKFTRGRVKAWCLLIHAEASHSHGGLGKTLMPPHSRGSVSLSVSLAFNVNVRPYIVAKNVQPIIRSFDAHFKKMSDAGKFDPVTVVGRSCRFTLPQPALKAPMVSALETGIS